MVHQCFFAVFSRSSVSTTGVTGRCRLAAISLRNCVNCSANCVHFSLVSHSLRLVFASFNCGFVGFHCSRSRLQVIYARPIVDLLDEEAVRICSRWIGQAIEHGSDRLLDSSLSHIMTEAHRKGDATRVPTHLTTRRIHRKKKTYS